MLTHGKNCVVPPVRFSCAVCLQAQVLCIVSLADISCGITLLVGVLHSLYSMLGFSVFLFPPPFNSGWLLQIVHTV